MAQIYRVSGVIIKSVLKGCFIHRVEKRRKYPLIILVDVSSQK